MVQPEHIDIGGFKGLDEITTQVYMDREKDFGVKLEALQSLGIWTMRRNKAKETEKGPERYSKRTMIE